MRFPRLTRVSEGNPRRRLLVRSKEGAVVEVVFVSHGPPPPRRQCTCLRRRPFRSVEEPSCAARARTREPVHSTRTYSRLAFELPPADKVPYEIGVSGRPSNTFPTHPNRPPTSGPQLPPSKASASPSTRVIGWSREFRLWLQVDDGLSSGGRNPHPLTSTGPRPLLIGSLRRRC